MKYDVILTQYAEEAFRNLERTQRIKLQSDYKTIKEIGTDGFNIKGLGNKLFEIKTDNLRSIFEYRKGQIIVVALIFVKKTQKTPPKYLKLAKNILEKFEKE
ncbi:MAG: type II toxin-antitoxin system RelE/ParE family toxin [Candidatus Gastranaerophilaceae bacterium]